MNSTQSHLNLIAGDRVRFRDSGQSPWAGDGYAYGTVAKVTKAYVHVNLDQGVYGGASGKLFGTVTKVTKFRNDLAIALLSKVVA